MIDERLATIDLRRYLAPLVRNAGTIALFCTTAAVTSLALTYIFSEKYRASTTVFYHPRESVSFQEKARDALGFPLPLVPLETITNTLEEIVTSDAALERTVRLLHLDVKEKPPPARDWLTMQISDLKDSLKELRQNAWEILKFGRVLPKDTVRGAMATLRSNVSVKHVNKAYLFELNVLNNDPQRAARIADTLGAILAEFLMNQESQTAHQTRANIERRLAQVSAEVERLRAQVEQSKLETGVASLDEQLSLRLKTINQFEEDRLKLQHQLQALESRAVELEAELNRQDGSVKYDSTLADNPVFNQLRLMRTQLEVERAGLVRKLTEKHKDVQAVDAKLADVEERLKAEQPKLVTSESNRINEVRRKVESDLISVKAEINAVRAQEQSVAQTLAREAGLTQKLIGDEPAMSQLQLRLAAAEQSYKLISEAYEEARLNESRAVSEVTLPGKALVPLEPARPIKILHVGVTFVLSLVLAIGFTFLVDTLGGKVYDVRDAEQILGVPVFSAIPAVKHSPDLLTGGPG
jgi:uncharacterized protein involved in exopolysaccharide biosynthesis